MRERGLLHVQVYWIMMMTRTIDRIVKFRADLVDGDLGIGGESDASRVCILFVCGCVSAQFILVLILFIL